MKNMSFAMTTEQFLAGTKTVTRRFGWWMLRPGDILMGVEKTMGLKKGEKMIPIHPFQVISARKEPLDYITVGDVIMEGFPGWTPADFVEFMVKHYGCRPSDPVNRIQFKHIMHPVYLEKWEAVSMCADPFRPPEMQAVQLHGIVKGHPRLEDGDSIYTSRVQDARGHLVTTLNTTYILGKPSKGYLAFLKKNYPDWDPRNPVKVHHA